MYRSRSSDNCMHQCNRTPSQDTEQYQHPGEVTRTPLQSCPVLPPLPAQAASGLFRHYRLVLSVVEFHINGICSFFNGWLFSPCPDFPDSSILLRPQFVSPFSCGWAQAAVNTFVQASSWRSLLGEYLRVQLCSLRVNGCLNLTGLDSFQSGCTILR